MEAFFLRTLPALILQSLHTFVLQQGTVHFFIGDEAWTLAFGADAPVRAGAQGDAQLALTFTPAAFTAFLDGTLDVGAAVGAGAISAEGDLQLLEQFSRLLRPPSDALWP